MPLDNCSHINFATADIGEMHNQAVIALCQNANLSDPNVMNVILANYYLQTYNPMPLGVTRPAFDASVLSLMNQLEVAGYDLRNLNTPFKTRAAYPFIKQILDNCDNISTLSDFNLQLDQIQDAAENTLTCEDYDVFEGTLQIARASAKLWLPVNAGGLGYYDLLFTVNKKAHKTTSLKGAVGGAITGDVTSSAMFFTGGAIGWAIGLSIPGANAAILGGWAISAGLGSAWGGFRGALNG